jgi:hypothetical protein
MKPLVLNILTSKCLKSEIRFNTEALEKLVYEPEWVLDNEEEFWSKYPSQVYTKKWAEQVNYKIDYEDWRKTINEWSEISPQTRQNKDFLKNTERIIEGKQIFIEKALPHVCSYLPKAANLDIGIHFTAYIPARAFAMGEIVVNMTATYWNNNPDNILNTMVHELFHVGYSYCRDQRENETTDTPLFDILENIHSEGICTYIGYKAQDIFPAPDEKDYQMIDDAEEVKKHLGNVNVIISKVGKISKNELIRQIWDIGVIGRSFYVTGAQMCQVIEKKADKEALIQTLIDGPRSFFDLYNSLVLAEQKILIPQ